MNLVKHMEAVFVLALAVAGSATYLATANESQPQPQLASHIATPTKMAVVIISAKRLTAAQKRELPGETDVSLKDLTAKADVASWHCQSVHKRLANAGAGINNDVC
jgi:Flp pilus assembly protein CpaB